MNKAVNKIIIPGGAGLVGQNLIVHLRAQGYRHIVVLDKHRANLEILKNMQADIVCEYADLSRSGDWQRHFVDADTVIMLQAQIGGNKRNEFLRNNLDATQLILEAIRLNNIAYLIHVSSSVVKSVAKDYYTQTKTEQELRVLASNIPCVVLRPTLMFGWFDRKHFGWLSRFMQKVPIFLIPGEGCYMRQPLYVADFCNIIINCVETRREGGIYNISGHERINYIDIIREIKKITAARTRIVKIPYSMFYALLWLWGLFDRNPPFTTQQLQALVADDEFEVIDWPAIFNVTATPFAKAIDETFNTPVYSKITLEF
ncbi:N/A [soil metagenome]